MAKLDLYTLKGVKKAEGLTLPKDWTSEANMALIAQTLRVYEDNSHPGMAKAQTRGEVNRTGKKLYKQKGTGGARHGSRKAPIFVGGGVAHGPRPLRRILNIPTKLKREALRQVLGLKIEDGKMVAVEGFGQVKKTKEVGQLLEKITGKNFSFVLSTENQVAGKFVSNLKNAEVYLYRNLNAYQVFHGGTLVLDSSIFETKKIEKKVDTKKTTPKVKTAIKKGTAK